MRPGAVLINTARGGLVDQAALAGAFTRGRLRRPGLDVFAHEPVDPAEELLRLPNVVLAPHVAWLTADTFARSFPSRRRTAGGCKPARCCCIGCSDPVFAACR